MFSVFEKFSPSLEPDYDTMWDYRSYFIIFLYEGYNLYTFHNKVKGPNLHYFSHLQWSDINQPSIYCLIILTIYNHYEINTWITSLVNATYLRGASILFKKYMADSCCNEIFTTWSPSRHSYRSSFFFSAALPIKVQSY